MNKRLSLKARDPKSEPLRTDVPVIIDISEMECVCWGGGGGGPFSIMCLALETGNGREVFPWAIILDIWKWIDGNH